MISSTTRLSRPHSSIHTEFAIENFANTFKAYHHMINAKLLSKRLSRGPRLWDLIICSLTIVFFCTKSLPSYFLQSVHIGSCWLVVYWEWTKE